MANYVTATNFFAFFESQTERHSTAERRSSGNEFVENQNFKQRQEITLDKYRRSIFKSLVVSEKMFQNQNFSLIVGVALAFGK